MVNGWARDLVSQYFGYSCVSINSGDKFITVADSQCLDPISIITGGRRYAFVINDAQFCLVKNCYNRQDRHQFVTQSLTIGPTAFVDGVSDSARAEAGQETPSSFSARQITSAHSQLLFPQPPAPAFDGIPTNWWSTERC